jgi:hypothetical protein
LDAQTEPQNEPQNAGNGIPGSKLKKIIGEYALTHVAFGHWYPPIILEQNWMLRIYAENGISGLQISKISPQTRYS